jgi:hypothetical protein
MQMTSSQVHAQDPSARPVPRAEVPEPPPVEPGLPPDEEPEPESPEPPVREPEEEPIPT